MSPFPLTASGVFKDTRPRMGLDLEGGMAVKSLLKSWRACEKVFRRSFVKAELVVCGLLLECSHPLNCEYKNPYRHQEGDIINFQLIIIMPIYTFNSRHTKYPRHPQLFIIGSGVGGKGAKSLSPDMEEDSQRIACLDGTKFFHLILLGKTDRQWSSLSLSNYQSLSVDKIKTAKECASQKLNYDAI